MLLSRFKSSDFYMLFNLQDEKAKGRTVMMASSVISSIIGWLTGSLFYTSFLMQNGIDLVKIGIISFVPYIANCFAIFAPSILERFPQRRWVLFGGRLAYYSLNILAVTLMPALIHDPDARTIAFAVLVFAANITNALFAGGYTAWHLNFIPNNIRAAYFSTSSMVANFLGIGMGLLSSVIADAFAASPYAYTIIIVLRFVAYGLALVELWALAQPVEYPYEKSGSKVRLSDIFTKPLSHTKYMLTLLIICTWTFFANTSASSTNYYLLNNIGTSYTFIFVLNIFYPVCIMFLLKPTQKILRRYGWFLTFAVGSLLYAIPTFLYSFVTSANYLWLLTIVRLSQHVFGVPINTAYSNLPYVNMPETDRTNYLAFHTICTNAAAFLGMLAGTWFVGAFPDILLKFGPFSFCNMQILLWVETFGRIIVPTLILLLIKKITPAEQ